jgi:hypothetical protein
VTPQDYWPRLRSCSMIPPNDSDEVTAACGYRLRSSPSPLTGSTFRFALDYRRQVGLLTANRCYGQAICSHARAHIDRMGCCLMGLTHRCQELRINIANRLRSKFRLRSLEMVTCIKHLLTSGRYNNQLREPDVASAAIWLSGQPV